MRCFREQQDLLFACSEVHCHFVIFEVLRCHLHNQPGLFVKIAHRPLQMSAFLGCYIFHRLSEIRRLGHILC